MMWLYATYTIAILVIVSIGVLDILQLRNKPAHLPNEYNVPRKNKNTHKAPEKKIDNKNKSL